MGREGHRIHDAARTLASAGSGEVHPEIQDSSRVRGTEGSTTLGRWRRATQSRPRWSPELGDAPIVVQGLPSAGRYSDGGAGACAVSAARWTSGKNRSQGRWTTEDSTNSAFGTTTRVSARPSGPPSPMTSSSAWADPRSCSTRPSGRGEFISAVPARERWAIDQVPSVTDLESQGIHTIVSDMFDVELPPEHFDGILLSNLLEHLMTYEDVQRCLRKMHAAIRPGGVVAVLGPNFKYCAKEYFDCADHVLALTDVSVQEHLYAAGFEIQSVLPRYLPYSFRGRLPPSERPDPALPAQSVGVSAPRQAVPRDRRGLTRPASKEQFLDDTDGSEGSVTDPTSPVTDRSGARICQGATRRGSRAPRRSPPEPRRQGTPARHRSLERVRWRATRDIESVSRPGPGGAGLADVDRTPDRGQRHRLVVASRGHHGGPRPPGVRVTRRVHLRAAGLPGLAPALLRLDHRPRLSLHAWRSRRRCLSAV